MARTATTFTWKEKVANRETKKEEEEEEDSKDKEIEVRRVLDVAYVREHSSSIF